MRRIYQVFECAIDVLRPVVVVVVVETGAEVAHTRSSGFVEFPVIVAVIVVTRFNQWHTFKFFDRLLQN